MNDTAKTILKTALNEGATLSTLETITLDEVSDLPRLDLLTFNDLISDFFSANSILNSYTFKLVSDHDDDGALIFTLKPYKDGVETLEEVAHLNSDYLNLFSLNDLLNNVISYNNYLLEFIDLSAANLKDRLELSRALNVLTKALARLKALYTYKVALIDYNQNKISPAGYLSSELSNDNNKLDGFKGLKLFTLETFKEWLEKANDNSALNGYFKVVKGLEKGSGNYLYYFTNRNYTKTAQGLEIGALDLTASGLYRLTLNLSDWQKINLKNTTYNGRYFSFKVNNDLETLKGALNNTIYDIYINKYLENSKGGF